MVALIEYAAWLISKGHAVIHTHRQSATRIALAFLLRLLEDAAKIYQMATSTQMGCLGEVTVREDVAGTQVNEVSAVGKTALPLPHSRCAHRQRRNLHRR